MKRRVAGIIVACLVGATAGHAGAMETPAVAAASDLKFALEDIATRFRADTQREVRLAFGSSGNFFRQITQGAPYQLFLSADEEFVHRLHEAGLTADRGVLYAIGRIVLFAPTGSPLEVDDKAAGLKAALAGNRIRRFAIANPEHAPYGRAAEQALRKLGLWEALGDKRVLGENVSQAAQFATSGSAQGGIFAYSLALSPEVAKRGRYVLLPDDLHAPLRQRMVLLNRASPGAERLYAYLRSDAARAILARNGFLLPEE
jgi:molybdate transport system substrate-binding protein